MPKFPEPPSVAALRAVGAEVRTLAAGTTLWRIYFRGGPFPTRWDELRSFGPTESRFDHHDAPPRVQSRAVLYAAEHGHSCVAEVFQTRRLIDRHDRDPWLVAFALARDVELLDLTGAWPTRAGASTAIHSGSKARARRWSSAIYRAFPAVEGLAYCSSMDGNRRAIALNERAADALPRAPAFHRALADPSLRSFIGSAALRFGYAVV